MGKSKSGASVSGDIFVKGIAYVNTKIPAMQSYSLGI